MIVATGSRSKKFGDVCYTFVIFSTNISDFVTERLLTRLSDKNYPLYFFLVILVNCSLHFICIYFLVGSRIQLLMSDPEFDATTSTRNSKDITQYVALRSKIKSMSIYKRLSMAYSFSVRNSISLNSRNSRSTFTSYRTNSSTIRV